MPIRAVLLDADGVAQVNPSGWLDSLRAIVDRGRGGEFTEDLFATEKAAMVGDRDFREVVREVAERWHVAERVDDLLQHWRRVEVVTATLELVGDLRARGVRCYLVSNQNAFRAAFMQDALGYRRVFDGAFYSCDLGVLKSSERFFEQVLEQVGLPREDVVLVDDNEEYVAVARRCGLGAVCWSTAEETSVLRTALGVEQTE